MTNQGDRPGVDSKRVGSYRGHHNTIGNIESTHFLRVGLISIRATDALHRQFIYNVQGTTTLICVYSPRWWRERSATVLYMVYRLLLSTTGGRTANNGHQARESFCWLSSTNVSSLKVCLLYKLPVCPPSPSPLRSRCNRSDGANSALSSCNLMYLPINLILRNARQLLLSTARLLAVLLLASHLLQEYST